MWGRRIHGSGGWGWRAGTMLVRWELCSGVLRVRGCRELCGRAREDEKGRPPPRSSGAGLVSGDACEL